MKITIKGFLTLRKVMDAEAVIDIEGDVLTVDDLLCKLSDTYGENFKKMYRRCWIQ